MLLTRLQLIVWKDYFAFTTLKIGLFKQFVKALNNDDSYVKYICKKFNELIME